MTAFEVVDVDEQRTAVVKGSVPMAELRPLFDRAFGEVFAAIGQQGVQPAGPPFGYYPEMPGETVTVEIGVPVPAAVETDGDVVASTLPGGRVVRGTHIGSYETLSQTYEELMAWASEHEVTLAPGMWESYLSDPRQEPDPATWRTEICWPLAR